MATRDDICCIPHCSTRRSAEFKYPLCTEHARRIYFEVRSMLDNATVAQRVASTDLTGKGTAHPRRGHSHGFVYFFLCGELVKIGWTSNVQRRARSLKADRILGCFPGTTQDEKAMHARFGHLWDRGEYFLADPELIEYAESVGRAA